MKEWRLDRRGDGGSLCSAAAATVERTCFRAAWTSMASARSAGSCNSTGAARRALMNAGESPFSARTNFQKTLIDSSMIFSS